MVVLGVVYTGRLRRKGGNVESQHSTAAVSVQFQFIHRSGGHVTTAFVISILRGKKSCSGRLDTRRQVPTYTFSLAARNLRRSSSGECGHRSSAAYQKRYLAIVLSLDMGD